MRADEETTFGAAASTAQPVTGSAKIAGLYDLEETLGSGHFAVVKLARHVFTGVKVAVKVVDKTKLDNVSKAHLFQEVRCMKLVQHPNVVRLYEVIDTQTKLYLILELGDGGDLYDYIMKHDGGLSENLARKYFCQILRAIAYCHQLHVVHRDLKPENVVFFEKLGIVKLTDFGFSNNFLPGQKLETFCGSLAYSAPEILLGESYDAPPVDIWSLGVILYMLVCGTPPFEKGNDSETLTMIMDCKYSMPAHVSQQCQKLIGLMLVREPKKRATLDEIASDLWLKDDDDPCDLSDYLPLVSQHELTEEDHMFITQKMINGNIASKDEILQSLEKSKYNHVTATYYLLAEMRLRKYREDRMLKQIPKKIELGNLVTKLKRDKGSPEQLIDKTVGPANINFGPSSTCANREKSDKRSRKCSIVREEDEDEFTNDSGRESNQLKVLVTRRESTSDRSLNCSGPDNLNKISISLDEPLPMRTKMVISINAPLTQKFNRVDKHSKLLSNLNIDEKKEQSSEKPFVVQEVFMGFKNLEIKKMPSIVADCKNPFLTHRRPKSNKNCTPSCSSSEASDDDSKARSKKKINKFVGDMPTRFQMHRRDSHDDSSDSQDQTLPSSSTHSLTSNLIFGNKSSHGSEKKGQTKDKEPNKTEGKSSHSNSQKSKKQSKSLVEKSFQKGKHFLAVNCVRRKRIRVSQPLDRITEAQEFQLRNRNLAKESHSDEQNLATFKNQIHIADTREEYKKEQKIDFKPDHHVKHSLDEIETRNRDSLKSVEGVGGLICDNDNVTKSSTNLKVSNCLVAVNEIRRLRKYFPVVNFS